MSGGHFNYTQFQIDEIASEVEQIILRNDPEKKDYDSYSYEFSEETIAEFKKGLNILKQAYVYVQRIDWLVSGDDGEETFRKRLKAELEQLNDSEN